MQNVEPSAARSSVDRVRAALRERGLDAPITEFDASTRTAADAAATIGTTVAQIVKSLVFLAEDQPIVVLVSGENRASLSKLSALTGQQVRRADAEVVRHATGFAIGGVPPLGHSAPLPVYVDEDLLRFETVWAAAGTPSSVFPVAPGDLVRATEARVADLKE